MKTQVVLIPVVLCSLFLAGGAVAGDATYLNSSPNKELPFSEAVKVGGTLYLSGQIGAVPGALSVVPGGLEPESRQALDNIRSTLKRYGYTLDDVVKCTVMLADMSQWGAFNEIYRSYFTKHFPARSAFGANGLALGAKVEIECIAAK